MKTRRYGRFWVVLPVLMLPALAGCDDNDSADVDGILAIIYAVGDIVIGIIRAAT